MPFAAEFLPVALHFRPDGVERDERVIAELSSRANFQRLAQRSLGNEERLRIFSHEHAQALAQEIVGNLVELLPALGLRDRCLPNRPVNRIDEAGFVSGIEPGIEQNLRAGLA